MSGNEALQTFIMECRELTGDMEDALMRVEQGETDGDTINAIFRAAHTIKGSAGLFGLDHIVEFTHVTENVLDKVRDGDIAIDATLSEILLKACDQIVSLVARVAETGGKAESLSDDARALMKRLGSYLGSPEKSEATVQTLAKEGAKVEIIAGDGVASDNWHISLRFGIDSLRNGMDPISFIRYLGTLGRLVNIVTLHDTMPIAADMDPESCYLGFEIQFASEATKEEIEDAFEFVREDSIISILPPHSKIAEFTDIIRDLPEDEMRIGEILVRCGALTEAELEKALQHQDPDSESPAHQRIGEVLVEQKLVQPEIVAAALEKQKVAAQARVGEAAMIRVDAGKLEQLINLVGELIISGAGTAMLARDAGIPKLLEATTVMSRLVEEVRDSALSLRMVQIGTTFHRFQRVVRDVSKELGKDIELSISGGETELDKTLVEKIGDPLTHLVRNAMDHGIEAADVRIAKGKPVKGHVGLTAYHDAGSIVIEVSDDGAGLSRDKILQKAISRGLTDGTQPLSDQEVFHFIFEPGFSTADKVSNLSGRGVGMDVVRSNIQLLRGQVEIDSEEGSGTTIRIRLPLTLAIIDGFLVGIDDATFVVPLEMVEECIEFDHVSQQYANGRDYLNLRGEVLPFFSLRKLFGFSSRPPCRENVVVAHYAGQRFGLVVDKLMGEFQTVIKPLGEIFSRLQGIGGSTILGNGEVALILDVPGLVQRVSHAESRGRDGDGIDMASINSSKGAYHV